MTKLEEFSGGYYRAQLTVQPFPDGPSIEQGLYELINRRIYDTTNAPVTMRASLSNGPRFLPRGEHAMPTDVIGLPRDLLDEMGIHPAAEDVSFFVLKPQAAYRFNNTLHPSGEYCYREDGECPPQRSFSTEHQ